MEIATVSLINLWNGEAKIVDVELTKRGVQCFFEEEVYPLIENGDTSPVWRVVGLNRKPKKRIDEEERFIRFWGEQIPFWPFIENVIKGKKIEALQFLYEEWNEYNPEYAQPLRKEVVMKNPGFKEVKEALKNVHFDFRSKYGFKPSIEGIVLFENGDWAELKYDKEKGNIYWDVHKKPTLKRY